ncbi:helix-turn-helix transcriptional regulator [Mycobacteroides chelonae]|uniref:helix-turn-helix transcriptional regulator n=1 Tax=Mycobacteroides chelonae TaxID=1774 RepID=UPI00190FBFE1|nr:AraC family transcriptional regulator [Mycobacteroides chelonae]MBV0917965.1 AraC family transcriptional regulator [Mycobacteroides chelonae]MEC4903369.1 AraC family transcriptional regulator [Mycobacteroides chelonae]QQG95597.1 helix-turn-helix transcriptional regulator [Mycobacteroides chelonae]
MSGLAFDFISATITRPTDWLFDEPHHVIAIYTGGLVRSKETDFNRGPIRRDLPKKGDILVIPAGERVGITAQGQLAEFSQLNVPTKLLEHRELTPRFGYRDPLLHLLTNRIHSLAHREDLLGRLLRDSLTDVIRLHLCDHYAAIRRPHGDNRTLDPITQAKLIEFIEEGMDTEIDLDTLARYADMSVSPFIKAFAAAFHTTPYRYVLDRRIDHAKKLLTATTLSITEISAHLRFSSPSHFATAFKTRVGVTPTAYRAL